MSAKVLATRYATDTRATVLMVQRLQSLRAQNVLTIAELELATEAALLSIHTSFETFVRELYLGCVIGTTQIPGIRSRIRTTSVDDAQALIASDRQFVEWLPISKTMERANIHLRGGQPFVRLWGRDQVMRHLDLMQVVRNRVAHSSEQALLKYDKKISRGEAAFERPARWLLHASSAKTNLELIADSTIAASTDLVADERTPRQLGPAQAYAGQRAVPGTYRCVSCQRVQHLRTWEKLEKCPRCTNSTHCLACGTDKPSRSTWRLEALKSVG